MKKKYPEKEHLPFVSDRSCQCLSCRNFIRTCVSGVSGAAFEEELSQQGLGEYMASLASFEELFDKTPGYAKKIKDKVPVPTWVNSIEEEGTETIMNQGVFWPKEIFEEHEGRPLDKKDIVAFKYLVKTYHGVWRDKKCGVVMGTITQNKVHSQKAQKVKQLADSTKEFRKTGVDDAFRIASGIATGFDMKRKKHDGGDDSIDQL